jgi:hypothetical protein
LTICRRVEPGQEEHYYLVRSLYERPYFKPGHPDDPKLFKKTLEDTLAELMPKFRPFEYEEKTSEGEVIQRIPDCVAVMSHKTRIVVNILLNELEHNQRLESNCRFVKWSGWGGVHNKTSMEPQSAWLWLGQLMVSVSNQFKLTNGYFYRIKAMNNDGAELEMHGDYCKHEVAKKKEILPTLRPFVAETLKYVGSEKPLQSVSAWMNKTFMNKLRVESSLDMPNKELLCLMGFEVESGKVVPSDEEAGGDEDDDPDRVGPRIVKLSWSEFTQSMRLTRALPYCYYQGRTLKDTYFMLMSTRSPHFSMRHLIMGLGRVTRGDRVCIASPELEKLMLETAEKMQRSKDEEAVQALREAQYAAEEETQPDGRDYSDGFEDASAGEDEGEGDDE